MKSLIYVDREEKDNTIYLPSLEEILSFYKNGRYLVLDFEATNYSSIGEATEKDNNLILACFYDSKSNKYYFDNEQNEFSLLKEYIQVSDYIVAHNAKFELQWLKRLGYNLREISIYDTYLAQWVLDGNLKLDRSLELLANRYDIPLKKEEYVSKLIKLGVNVDDIPRTFLRDYCRRDVELTLSIFKKQRNLLIENNLFHIAFQRFETCKVLADIEFNGMTLDKERVLEECARNLSETDKTLQELVEKFGNINYGSSKQLSKLIYEDLKFPVPKDHNGNEIRSPKGELSVSKSKVIPLLIPKTKAQKEFLELYTKYSKLRSLYVKNLKFFKNCVEYNEGKFYGRIVQGVTATHRLASSGKPYVFPSSKRPMRAQFQNLPREFKKLFRAEREDWVIVEFDAAQLEFRVAAELCNDPVAIADIRNGVDVHQVTADVLSKATGKTISRQEAKAHTFAPLYGSLGKTDHEKAYVKFFRSKYSKIASEQDSWAMIVSRRKELRTKFGMVYRWPHAKVLESGSVNVRTEVFNYPIQGSATAEIVPIGLVCCWYRTEGLPCRIINTIHDSVVVEALPSCVEQLKRQAVYSMTSDVFRFLSKVYGYEWGETPLGVGFKVSSHWGDTKREEIFDVLNTNPPTITCKVKE